MERKTKLTIAKAAVVLGAIPLLLWAYEYGPDPGVSGVPKENGTCAQSGCHTGTTNDPANKGSVAISFPNGMTYTPGVAQHLTVTVSDPASAQSAWGFQLTPRVAGNTATMAGTLASLDTNTALMCSQPDFNKFEAVCLPGADPQGRCISMSAPACPASETLQYMEHSYTGYLSTMGKGSGTYQLTWTPPATNVGNVTFYVAGNAGVGGPPTQNGDHIYATTYTLTPAAATAGPPSITMAQSASGFGPFASVAPGSWMEIFGANLAPPNDMRSWAGADFNGNNAPTSLDGVSVTIGSQSAFVYYISPTQVNAQVPSNVSTGSQPIAVTVGGVTSPAYNFNVNALEPGLLAPSSFLLNGKQYVVAQFTSDNSFVLPTGALSGYTTRPAKAGDSIVIYGVGFGPAIDSSTNLTIPAGLIATTSQLVTKVQMQINGVAASLGYQGLAPGQIGVDQFNLTVPPVTAGDQPLTFTQNGASGTQKLYLSVQ